MSRSKFIGVKFELPYIIQPKGTYNFNYRNEPYTIAISHEVIPQLQRILTGTIGGVGKAKITITDKMIVTGAGGELSIQGPREIYVGTSNVNIKLPSSFESLVNDQNYDSQYELRRRIVALLNEYQYQYLNATAKYWWNSISPDHFINMNITTERFESAMMSWHLDKDLLSYTEDERVKEDLIQVLNIGEKLSLEDLHLIDTLHHFLTGEYHLMYVELGIAFESLVSKCEQKIYGSEKRLFKEGKLVEQLSHLLSQKCQWSTDKLQPVGIICIHRNNVIHNNA